VLSKLAHAGATLALAMSATAYAQTEKFYTIAELSGAGASAGTNFKNGVELAVKEINASGGILGRRIETVTLDTQSNPGVAKGLAQRAVDDNAFAVFGPVFSGSIMVSMTETKRGGVPNFTGGEATSITQQGNPFIFRTSFTQATSMPKIARYVSGKLKAKTVAVMFANNDFGKGGRDAIMKALDAVGVKVVADHVAFVEVGIGGEVLRSASEPFDASSPLAAVKPPFTASCPPPAVPVAV